MKKAIAIACVLMFGALPAWAETIHVGVNGLVCAFCVKGVENGFAKHDAVASIKVDLDSKSIALTTKPNQTISDAEIETVIADAGYTLTGIKRQN